MTKPDWEAIESAYRAGVLSVREIASHHGLTHTSINKRAKRDGWERDLKAKVKAKADALVSKREVSRQVSTETALTERQLIEASAEVIANVRMQHRGDIKRARELANALLDELAGECSDVSALNELGEMLRQPDDKGMDKLNDLYQKVISMPSRVKAMKDLGDTLKTLIGLEREAYDITAGNDSDDDTPVQFNITVSPGH
ncbi:hypothetical protein LVQ77_17055 [Buttiauxella sp. S04-F03]|uniref:hypothetical protein n=1 Tax=Buttiauxella sp. W03-F01 TaxID=2904524 RepID=UPI001E43CE40|nr:hypothetical protein [Buttiauxella sp. W03-F01]MCE0801995.1 hypothetical protein [Buttiauxella sp. W03-F01]